MELYILAGIVIMAILFVIILVLCISNNRQLRELNDYAQDGDLANTLKLYYKKISDLRSQIHDLTDTALIERISACEEKLNGAYTKLFIVNFDAFDDVTGKQSFALTLLNNDNSGFILTSLYGHNSSNTYIRYVINGATNVKLTEEEKLSLSKAISGEKKVLSGAV